MLLDRSLPSPRAQAPALGRARLTLSLGSWVALTLSSCGSDHGTADDMNAIAELDASSADAHVGGDPLDGALHASDATHGLDAGVHEQPQQDGSAGHSADSGQGHTADYCLSAEPPDPRDKMLSGQPEPWLASTGEIDLVLPKPVLDWMDERIWKPSHDAWHNIRRCDHGGFSGIPLSAVDFSICVNRVLIPEDQECENPSDGYQFLVMHRHMIQSLKQAFPEHAQLFEGFPSFPYQATDVPEQWRDRWGTGWAPAILASADTLENIEQNLSQFASEGELGQFIQCGSELDGVHGALHFKWVVNESPNSLGKQTVNIGNYMFWKLHGWIDRIWERYRIAKGLTPDEPKLRDELVEQCREMHALGQVIDPSADPPTSDPLPDEAGFFHESVRPILDRRCSGCHSEASPEGRMSLGGHISSADVVAGLVSVQSVRGGQFMRVVPGQPAQSWLYLKVSGMAASAGCQGSMCNLSVMPPAGEVILSEAELATIRQWIADGAQAPTQSTAATPGSP